MRYLLFFFLVTHILFAQNSPNNFQKLDVLLEKYAQKSQAMGNVAISKWGKPVYTKAFGDALLNPEIANNDSTIFRIGSITKTFTATLILQFVAEGKLNLTDSLARFFPGWPNANKITIEHLLRHESGIYNFGNKGPVNGLKTPETKAEVLAAFENAPTDFKPGKKHEYNNANYVVLSLIAEELSDKTFESLLAEKIFEPLLLQNTHAGGPINTKENEALSFFWQRSWQPNGDFYTPTLQGAGAIASTPSDVNTFINALFAYQLLPNDQLLDMLTMKNNVGLGLNQFPFYNKTAFGHAGNLASFESFTAYFPEEKVAFTICLNANRKDFNEILISCLTAYFGL